MHATRTIPRAMKRRPPVAYEELCNARHPYHAKGSYVMYATRTIPRAMQRRPPVAMECGTMPIHAAIDATMLTAGSIL